MLFDQLVIESKAGNVIGLSMSLSNLQRALKSGTTAPSVVAKLSRRTGSPCLSFEIRLVDEIVITQDVPVQVLVARELESLKEPALPAPDVRAGRARSGPA